MTPLAEAPMQKERATTIYEKSKTGRRAAVLPDAGVPEKPLAELIPSNLLRSEPPRLPEIAEPEIVRHYNRLSRRNFDLDSGFYPLGSCTMKHNPRLNERVAALPGHARLHPAQDPRRAQGALELMYLLQESLSEICGLPSVSLQPSAGSHGELAGLLLTRAYHADRGETRTKVLAPDTSHGTNPASVTMAGYEVVKVATNERGGVDMDDLRAKIAEDPDQIACLMLTNPNTLGLFDENIEEIAALIHEAGGTLYYDGANLNAIMGRTRPGDMGFDIVHLNLHKSFSQPHGGGGPGAGPIAVSSRIEPFLPRPQVVRREAVNGHRPRFDLDFQRPQSIGRLRGFQGNFGVFVRSYAYILSLGSDGLTEASENAVVNANKPQERLAPGGGGGGPADPLRPPLHARVRPLRAADEERARAGDARPRQAAARLRLPPADRLLPALGRRGADGRADRDRDEGEPRRLRRRDRGDPHRGRDRSGAGEERALLDPGAPAGRGAGDAQAGGAAVARRLING